MSEDLLMKSNPGGTSLQDIRSDVTGLQVAYRGLASDVKALSVKIDALVSRMGESMRTPWATLASWAAVIITIMILSFAPLIQRQLSQEDRIETLRNDVHQIEVTAARDVAVNETRIQYLEKEVDKNHELVIKGAISASEAKAELQHLSEEIARLRNNLNETQLTLPVISGAQ